MNLCIPRLAFILSIVIAHVSLSGCLGTRDWQYPPASTGTYINKKPERPIPARVAVLPFEDLRGNTVKEEYWKVAVPLIPYGETKYDRPETAEEPEPVDVVRFNPSMDFAQATASEIEKAGVFSSVTFAKEGDLPPTDLVLRGRLKSTEWNRSITTYLLGPVGTVFWILGLPMGNTVTKLELDLGLTSVAKPSKVLWSMSMEFEGKQLDGPYYGLKDAVMSYPFALQESLRPAIADLVNLANEHPERLQR